MPKPAFDPNQPFEEAKTEVKPAFDPGKPFEEAKPISMGESAVRGVFEGVSLGAAPKISGALEAIGSQIGVRGLGKGFNEIRLETPEEKDQNFSEVYEAQKSLRRSQDQRAMEANPKTYMAGTLAGSAALPGATTIKGAGLVGALGAAAGSDKDFGSGEYLKDVAIGAGYGVGFGILGKGIEKLGSKAINKYADIKAAKAAGLMKKDLKKMTPDQLEQFGRELLERKIVSFGDDLESIAKKAGTAQKSAGKEIGNILDKADDLVVTAKNMVDDGVFGSLNQKSKDALKAQIDDEFQFGMQRVGQKIREKLIGPNKNNPNLENEITKLTKLAQSYESKSPVSLAEGRIIKSSQGKQTKFELDPTIPQAFKREVYDIIKDELEGVVGNIGYLEAAVAKAKGIDVSKISPEQLGAQLAESFKKANKTFSVVKKAGDAAKNRLDDMQKNRSFGLSELITGGSTGAGLLGGLLASGADIVSGFGLGTLGALAVGGLTKVAKTYGNSTIAKSAHEIAKIMAKSPDSLGKFRQVLENAAKNGSLALTVTHMQLMKDPEYRQISGTGDN